MKRKELEQKIEEAKAAIKEKSQEIENFELDPDDYEKQYDEFLDEMTGEVKIGSLTFDASRILKELDPTAYRCGLNDWLGGEDKTEDRKYRDMAEELEELENQLADLEAELDAIED